MARMQWVVSSLLLMTLAVAGGCQLFGMGAYLAMPEKVKAEYKPPKTPMLVLVENRRDPGVLVPEAESLMAFVVDDLNAYEVAPQVDWRGLQKLRDNDPEMPNRTISEIGQAMGAQQVLYVDLVEATLGPGPGANVAGRVEARVRVVDVATGKRMYPTSSESRAIMLETPLSHEFRDVDVVGIKQDLLKAAGVQIGSLFHDVAAVR